MPTIIPVKFTYAARDLWFDPAGTGAQEADHVICSTERGTEIGLATGDAREVSEEELEHVIGHAQLRSVVRIATDSDLDRAEQLEGVTVYHAGTKVDESGQLVTNGGRVLDVTAVAPTFEAARAQAYAAVELIDFEGKTYRTDIGMRAIKGREA